MIVVVMVGEMTVKGSPLMDIGGGKGRMRKMSCDGGGVEIFLLDVFVVMRWLAPTDRLVVCGGDCNEENAV